MSERFLHYTVLFVAISFGGCQCQDAGEAERAAREYAKKIPGATGEVSCTQTDSDSDGYCSCTAFMQDGSLRQLNCGCEKYCFNCARGCKAVENVKFLR
jgi:hypothetical protein